MSTTSSSGFQANKSPSRLSLVEANKSGAGPNLIRAIQANIDAGQERGAIAMLEEMAKSPDARHYLKSLLRFSRRLGQNAILQQLLDIAIEHAPDSRSVFDFRLELARLISRSKDDNGMLHALSPIDAKNIDATQRQRLLDVLAMLDNPERCMEFARNQFDCSTVDIESVALRRIALLHDCQPKLARSRLIVLAKTLSNDSQLWEMASQQFRTHLNFYAAIGAQKKAIKFAARPIPSRLRLVLIELYARQEKHTCARLQLLTVRWTSVKSPQVLQSSLEVALRRGYLWIADSFASALLKSCPGDLEALIAQCWICSRTKRQLKGSEISTRVIMQIYGGRAVARSAWPVLIQALSMLGRDKDAQTMLSRSLAEFPDSKALLQIRESLASVNALVTRVKAR